MKRIITVLLIAITSTILIYTKPLNKINVVNAEITDLTNTTWIFNEEPRIIDIGGGLRVTFNINFTSNEIEFTQLIFEVNTYMNYKNQNTTITAYTDGVEWSNDYWKEITITSGTDATNTTLIEWLENNATIQENTIYIELQEPTVSGIQNIINWDDVYAMHDITMQNGEYQIFYSATQPTQEEDLTLITTTTLTTYTAQQTGYYIIRAYMEEEDTIYYSDYSTPYLYQLTPLTTPVITLNFNTIEWTQIANASYYNIYKNGQLYAQTQTNQWTTIENGNYQVQAITNTPGYTNSALSNTITQNNYNDIIGNGQNFFTLFTAMIDSQIYFITSMLNYDIWGINFYDLFRLLITIAIIIIIIKFITKGMA